MFYEAARDLDSRPSSRTDRVEACRPRGCLPFEFSRGGDSGRMRPVDDSVTRYREASERNDIEALLATLSPEAELVSPIAGGMVFRGAQDLRILFTAVYGTLARLRWHSEVGEGSTRVVLGRGFLGPVAIDDAMVFELAPDGRIRRIRPHLRPWLALTLFALLLGPKIARHPGTVLRALRRAPGSGIN